MTITTASPSVFATYTNPNITINPVMFATYEELFSVNSDLVCDVTLADPWAMETDPILGTDYTDSDDVIDADDEIKKLAELKRIKTLSSIKSMNCGLVPKIINPTWYTTRQYFKDGKYTTCSDRFTTAISISGLPNINNFNIKNNYFSENMYDAYNNKHINAFLLFVNEVQIDWSRITIVKSDDYYTLLISNMDNINANIQEVRLIYIPFEITYTEGQDEPSDGMVLFKFDENGLYGGLHTIIYTQNDRIKSLSYHVSSYYNYELALEYTLKITSENLFIFNYGGYFDPNHSSSIKTANIATIDSGIASNNYVICIWSITADLSEDNSVRALNEPYIKKIIEDTISSSDFDTSLFETQFDFTHNKSLDYNTNINNSINYIFDYDENKYDPIFINHKPIDVYEFPILTIMKRAAADTYDRVTMLRNSSIPSDGTTSFAMIFQNGMIPIFYSTIKYTETSFTFKPTYLKYTDTFEIVMFRNVRNILIKLDYDKVSKPDYLNINNCFIPKDELIIYTANRGDNNLCPINYTVDSNGNVQLTDPAYRYTQLYFGSKNQFIYERYTYTSTTNTIILSSKFKTAYNPDKFLLFVNGRLLNKAYYKILIQSLTTTGTIIKAIYTAKTLNSGDRVDVFYCNTAKLNRINTSGDLLIQCSKIKANNDGQSVFTIPYPYANYPKKMNSFFCIKHSLYVDKSKYVFYGSSSDSTYGNSIQFIDSTDYLDEGDDLTFVFPYYSNSSNTTSITSNTKGINFINRSIKITSDTDTIILNPIDANDIAGNFNDTSKLMLFINSTYIDPSRYTLTSANTIKFNEILSAPKFITVVLEIDTQVETNSGITLYPIELTATVDNDISFQLPTQYKDYSNSLIVFKGTVLLSPERYYVDNNNILYLSSDDTSMETGRSLMAVYALANDNSLIDFEYLYIDITSTTTSVSIPVGYFVNFKFTQTNVLLFVDTTFVDSSRYSINNVTKTISLNDPNDTLFNHGKKLTIVIAYKTTKFTNVVVNDKETIYFDDRYAEPYDTTTGAYKFNIPWPNLPFTDTQFFITKGASFIPTDRYSVTDSILTYFDTDAFEVGDKLRFTFVHNKEFVDIRKQQITIKLAPSQTQVNIPSPYYNIVNLQNRMILVYGDTIIDQSRYSIDNYNKKINLFDIPYAGDNLRELTILIFYTGAESNGAMAYLPESGYVTFIRSDTISNYNKEMYLLFVNGKKVSKSQLLDISNNLIKVQTDINRRYNLEVIDCTPTIKTLKDMYGTQSKWIQLLDPLPV